MVATFSTQLWVPCLVLSHAFALFWLLKAILRARSRHAAKPDDLLPDAPTAATAAAASTAVGAAAVAQGKPGHTTSADLEACSADDSSTLRDLGCSYTAGAATKVVLQGVWGSAQPGKMQALMGPSGAGKSTLMDMLAMRKSLGNLTGQLLVNGHPATASFVRHTSYVPQEDTFIPTMTSRETLTFYAGVSMGGSWTASGRSQRVTEVLAVVGLRHAEHTLVGGALPGGLNLRGLSGGERRRLSIAAGILGSPSVLFLDEPTSGLDSFAALSVMGYLQDFATSNQQTVIATIHQPRSAIWEMFDTVSLLASGRLMFHGSCADMLPWFDSLGYTYTRGSESDWVLDLVATGFSKPEHLFGHTLQTTADIAAAAGAFQRHQGFAKGSEADSKDVDDRQPSMLSRTSSSPLLAFTSTASYPTSWWQQFRHLLSRELAGATHNPFDVGGRILIFTYCALLAGILAYDADFRSVQGLVSRSNCIFGGMMLVMLLPYISISLYTSDKRLYLADASAKRYRPSAYYLAKVLSALPFHIVCTMAYSGVWYGMSGLQPYAAQFGKFACVITIFHLIACQVLHFCAVVCPNYDATFALSVVWTTIQQLYCSFFIQFSIVSQQWVTVLRYIAASYFALEALMVNEFTGSVLDCSGGLDPAQVDTISSGLVNTTGFQRSVIRQLRNPQPGCLFKEDVLLSTLNFSRPFGVSISILLGYLGVLHVLTFVALVSVARRERR